MTANIRLMKRAAKLVFAHDDIWRFTAIGIDGEVFDVPRNCVLNREDIEALGDKAYEGCPVVMPEDIGMRAACSGITFTRQIDIP